MIKRLFDKCVNFAGKKYAGLALGFVSFIKSNAFIPFVVPLNCTVLWYLYVYPL